MLFHRCVGWNENKNQQHLQQQINYKLRNCFNLLKQWQLSKCYSLLSSNFRYAKQQWWLLTILPLCQIGYCRAFIKRWVRHLSVRWWSFQWLFDWNRYCFPLPNPLARSICSNRCVWRRRFHKFIYDEISISDHGRRHFAFMRNFNLFLRNCK